MGAAVYLLQTGCQPAHVPRRDAQRALIARGEFYVGGKGFILWLSVLKVLCLGALQRLA